MSIAEAIDRYNTNAPEPLLKATDWQGGEVYQGDEFRIIDGEIVLEDDVEEYLDTKWGKVQTA